MDFTLKLLGAGAIIWLLIKLENFWTTNDINFNWNFTATPREKSKDDDDSVLS